MRLNSFFNFTRGKEEDHYTLFPQFRDVHPLLSSSGDELSNVDCSQTSQDQLEFNYYTPELHIDVSIPQPEKVISQDELATTKTKDALMLLIDPKVEDLSYQEPEFNFKFTTNLFFSSLLLLIEGIEIIYAKLGIFLNNLYFNLKSLSYYKSTIRVLTIPLALALGTFYSMHILQPNEPIKPSLEYLSTPYALNEASTYLTNEFSALRHALSSNNTGSLSLANFSAPKSPITVSAWVPWWSWKDGLDSSLSHQSSFGDISAFLFTLKDDGSITYKNDIQNLPNAISRVHAAGYKIEAAISEEPNASAILTLFQTKESRTKLIDTIMTTTTLFDGVDIDFEAVQFSSSESDKAKIRILFPIFLMELRERLHATGKTLSVSVGARTGVTDPNWNVYDYQSIGLIADKVKIMAYDLHNSKSNPGPVSSKKWISNILDYALSVVSTEKITVGLPSYAYLYSSDGKVSVITGNNFSNFLQKHSGTLTRDVESDMAHLSYQSGGLSYDLFFPDAQFYKAVMNLLNERKISSIGVWSIGNESPELWSSLNN